MIEKVNIFPTSPPSDFVKQHCLFRELNGSCAESRRAVPIPEQDFEGLSRQQQDNRCSIGKLERVGGVLVRVRKEGERREKVQNA